jgi:hypothetical protein
MATSTSQHPMTSTNPQDTPFHPSTSTENKQNVPPESEHSTSGPLSVSIPDGSHNSQREIRRNSLGEILQSPIDTWQPNLNRTQSWNQEDRKRRFYAGELSPTRSKALVGVEKGFTEVGEDAEDTSPDGVMMKKKDEKDSWECGKVGGYGSGANTAV